MSERRQQASKVAEALLADYKVINSDTGEETVTDIKGFAAELGNRYFNPGSATRRRMEFSRKGVEDAEGLIKALPSLVEIIADPTQDIDTARHASIGATVHMLSVLEKMVADRVGVRNTPTGHNTVLQMGGIGASHERRAEAEAILLRAGKREQAICASVTRLHDGFKKIAGNLVVDAPEEKKAEPVTESVSDLAGSLLATVIDPKLAAAFRNERSDAPYTLRNFLEDLPEEVVGVAPNDPKFLEKILGGPPGIQVLPLLPDWLEEQARPSGKKPLIKKNSAPNAITLVMFDLCGWVDKRNMMADATRQFMAQKTPEEMEKMLADALQNAKNRSRGFDLEELHMQIPVEEKRTAAARTIITDYLAPQLQRITSALNRDMALERSRS